MSTCISSCMLFIWVYYIHYIIYKIIIESGSSSISDADSIEVQAEKQIEKPESELVASIYCK